MQQETLSSPPALEQLLQDHQLALFLDFDGTLVEIASTPEGIAVPDSLSAGLDSVSQRLQGRMAFVSGRSVDDLTSHLGRLKQPVAGSHGADLRLADGTVLGKPARQIAGDVLERCRDFVAEQPGVSLEEKSHGAALHFRSAPDTELAVVTFAEELARSAGLAVKRGKCVAELVDPGATKSVAVDAFMAVEPFTGSLPVFVGDDVTDDDGMRAASDHGGFGIAVGDRISSAARYRLASVSDVRDWLGL